MNIFKKGKLRNLTNEELIMSLKKIDWNDRDLLREYQERTYDGRINTPGIIVFTQNWLQKNH